jgi:sulfur carrier protein
MRVKVNDKATEIPDGLTIAELLAHQKVKMPDMVSVQVNGTILKREDFPATQVRENDSVDFLYFMGGGGERRAVVGGR